MLAFAIRRHLAGVLGWGGFLALFAMVEASSFTRISGGSAQDKLQLAQGLSGLARSMGYLLPNPEHLDTLGGYIAWFLFGYMPFFFGIWGVVAGSGAARGDEEKGLVDQCIAAGQPRWRIPVVRLAAFGIAVVAAIAMSDVVVAAVALAGREELSMFGLVLQGVPVVGTALVSFALGFLGGQFSTTRRNALGASMLVMLALYLVNGFSREIDQLRPYRWVSPFSLYDLNDPLVVGGHSNLASWLALGGWVVALLALMTWLFSKRDLGAAIWQRPVRAHLVTTASRNPLLRSPVTAFVWEQRVGLVAWCLSIAAYAGLNVSLTRSMVGFFRSQSTGATLSTQATIAFGFGKSDPYAGYVGAGWFPVACLLLAAFGLTQVARWASDDTEGRLEMLLSTPYPRWRVIADRALIIVVASSILSVANGAAVLLALRAQNIDVDPSRVVLASTLMLPLALAFGLVGAATAATRPRPALALLASVLLLSYIIPLMAVPLFAPNPPPGWFLNLSIFRLYGIPLTDGTNWTGLLTLVLIALAGGSWATLAMQRREIGR